MDLTKGQSLTITETLTLAVTVANSLHKYLERKKKQIQYQ